MADPEDKQSTLYPLHQNCLQHNGDNVMQASKFYNVPITTMFSTVVMVDDIIQAVKAGKTGDEDIIWLAAEVSELTRSG